MSTTLPPGPDGACAPAQDEHDALPPGTRLGEFEVLKVLGVGGFGIVYLAKDHALERLVAVKEYMPSMMAARGKGTQVSLRSSLHQDTFTIGLRSFVNEAKLLARFNHPSLVKVYRFWEDNGTAYMAMPFYPGRTLKEERRSMPEVPSEAWLRALVDPLLGAMEVLHKEDVYHRDIAPDNILLLPDGPPVLLDFGAARSVIGDRTQSLTAVLKPSYAPIEQYADVGHLRQGAWTDLYALGAVLHFVVMGRPPTPSASRAVHDEQPLLSTLGTERTGSMPAKILKAIDWALTVSPHTRPQTVQQFRDALDGRIEPPQRTAPDKATGLRQEPSRAAPSGWAETLQVAGAEGDDRFRTEPPAFPASSSAPIPAAAAVPARAAAPAGDDATVVMPPASDGASALQSAPPPAPLSGQGPARPQASGHAPAGDVSQATPNEAIPAGNAPPPGSQRPRSSRALPPLFTPDEPEASGHSGTARTAIALAAVAVLAMGLGGWLLKDRLFAPEVQAVPSTAAVPASAAWVPPSAGSPSQQGVASPSDAGDAGPSVAAASAAPVPVPDWSGQAARPAASAAIATGSTDAASSSTVPVLAGRAPAQPSPSRKPPKASATATVTAAEPAASTPSQVCNARSTGTMASCMRRVCTQGAMYDHPQCAELRHNDQW